MVTHAVTNAVQIELNIGELTGNGLPLSYKLYLDSHYKSECIHSIIKSWQYYIIFFWQYYKGSVEIRISLKYQLDFHCFVSFTQNVILSCLVWKTWREWMSKWTMRGTNNYFSSPTKLYLPIFVYQLTCFVLSFLFLFHWWTGHSRKTRSQTASPTKKIDNVQPRDLATFSGRAF